MPSQREEELPEDHCVQRDQLDDTRPHHAGPHQLPSQPQDDDSDSQLDLHLLDQVYDEGRASHHMRDIHSPSFHVLDLRSPAPHPQQARREDELKLRASSLHDLDNLGHVLQHTSQAQHLRRQDVEHPDLDDGLPYCGPRLEPTARQARAADKQGLRTAC